MDGASVAAVVQAGEHRFLTSDRGHPRAGEAEAMLAQLSAQPLQEKGVIQLRLAALQHASSLPCSAMQCCGAVRATLMPSLVMLLMQSQRSRVALATRHQC